MRAVASPKNIADAERLARDIAHTEKEIAYYLDRLNIIDETVIQGFDDQPLHRENFKAAIASLQRRKDRLVRRQQELERPAIEQLELAATGDHATAKAGDGGQGDRHVCPVGGGVVMWMSPTT